MLGPAEPPRHSRERRNIESDACDMTDLFRPRASKVWSTTPALAQTTASSACMRWKTTSTTKLCKRLQQPQPPPFTLTIDPNTYPPPPSTRRVNARGVYLGCKWACKQFLEQEPHESGHRGWIINVASILGINGISGGAGKSLALNNHQTTSQTQTGPLPLSQTLRTSNLTAPQKDPTAPAKPPF